VEGEQEQVGNVAAGGSSSQGASENTKEREVIRSTGIERKGS
jgi:hypothetical protein